MRAQNPEMLQGDFKLPFGSQVFELYQKGLDPNYYGIHGTSVDAILYLARYGAMPIDGDTDSMFYYYKKSEDSNHLCDGYANTNSKIKYVLNRLRINEFTHYSIYGFDFDYIFDYPDQLDALIAQEIIPRRINPVFAKWIFDQVKKTKGVLITISDDISENFQVLPGDDCDFCVETENGLPIDFISGIQPLGDYEKQVLDRMQKYI